MNSELEVYGGQRDVRTIAAGEWFSRGRLQEAKKQGRLHALKVDRKSAFLGELNSCVSNDYGIAIVGIRIPSHTTATPQYTTLQYM